MIPCIVTDEEVRESGAPRVEGRVIEQLPYGLYRVGIEHQREVVAHAPGGAGRNFIRIVVGDRVWLELSPRDLTRGRIVSVVSRQ